MGKAQSDGLVLGPKASASSGEGGFWSVKALLGFWGVLAFWGFGFRVLGEVQGFGLCLFC